jgi:hypothetical protein
LMHDKTLAKIIVAFTYPGERLLEYPDDPDHARWITCELLPLLERRFPLLAAPAGRCLMGTSFGAVAALSTAVRFPGTYDSLLLQSGSFLYSDPGCGTARGGTSVRWCASLIITAPIPYARRSERSSPVELRGLGQGQPRNGADPPQHRDEDQLCRVTGRTFLGVLAGPARAGAVLALPR